MSIEWDDFKNQANTTKHKISFDYIYEADFESAKIIPDDRFDYGEDRYNMYVLINDRLHVVSFTLRRTDTMRIISLRKANKREEDFYHDT